MPYKNIVMEDEFECPKILELNNQKNFANITKFDGCPYVNIEYCESFGTTIGSNGCKFKDSCPNYQKKVRETK